MSEPLQTSAPSLAFRTATGFAWLTGQTVLGKGMTLISQIILAALLTPGDFGLFSMAMTANLLTMVVQAGGVRDVLIQRHRAFSKLAGSALWLSLALGVLGVVATLAAIPVATRFYQTTRPEELSRLLLVMSAQPLLAACGVVAVAKLHIDLRFGTIAALSLMRTLCDITLRVVLALMGWGAMSFVIAQVASTALHSFAAMRMTPPVGLSAPRLRYLLTLGNKSFLLTIGSLFFGCFEFVDYAILSLFVDERLVGIYYMAYTLSNQVVFLFANNAMGVLLPAIAQLKADSAAQAFMQWRASRVIAALIVPVCLSLLCLAGPLVHTVFGADWQEVVPILQLFCLGMVFRPHVWLAQNLLTARGQFGFRVLVAGVFLLIFSASALVGVLAAGIIGTAATISAYYAFAAGEATRLAARPHLRRWDIHAALFAPFLLGLALFLPALALDGVVRVLGVMLAALTYFWVLRLIAPSAVRDLASAVAVAKIRWNEAPISVAGAKG